MEKYKPEPGYREPYTEYGMEIVMFCAKHCLTKKALAAEAGIPYDSLLATIKGRRSGHNVKAAVAPVMARYEAAVRGGHDGRDGVCLHTDACAGCAGGGGIHRAELAGSVCGDPLFQGR